MKIIIQCALAAILAVSIKAADHFEGTFDMEVSSEGTSFASSVATKDGNVRMQMQDQPMPGEIIMRDGMKKILVIMPSRKMYMEMPIPEERSAGGASQDDSETDSIEEMPIRKTGKTREMHGYKVHEFVLDQEEGKTEVWATEEIGSMPLVQNPMMNRSSSPLRMLTGLSAFFPLEATGYKNGSKRFHMKVTNIEKKDLPDSLFEAPSDFRKMTVPKGMGGFLNR